MFYSLFWINQIAIFYEILTLYLVILTIFLEKFGLYLAFFETAYGQIWPILFFSTWQPYCEVQDALKAFYSNICLRMRKLKKHMNQLWNCMH